MKLTGRGMVMVPECLEMLRMFEGLPPHDDCNPCDGDGYFYKSIERKFPAEVVVYSKKLVAKEVKAWEKHRQAWIDKQKAKG